MNTPTQATPTVKRMSAGKRDLSKAVEQVHQKARPAKAADDVTEAQVRAIPNHLLLAAGDDDGRASFFDHDDSQKPLKMAGGKVHVMLSKKAALPDYRTKDNQRTHRSMITIPPGLRANIRAAFGVEKDTDLTMTTAIIALADYAAMMLRRDGKLLVVEPAEDPYAEERKAAKKKVRSRARSK